MQIAVTKKLADAMHLRLPANNEMIEPLYLWTANWVKVWDNRKTEDMLVLVNNLTKFVVAVYQVKRKDLNNLPEIIKTAIENTMLSLNFNPEIVNEYICSVGQLEFVRNNNRKAAAWVTKAGQECAFYVGKKFNGISKVSNDRIGASVNYRPSKCSSGHNEWFVPYQEMANALAALTGKQPYKYRAYEVVVTLDLEAYQAKRRLIVPANLTFMRFHDVLQNVFGWRNCHLHDFTFYNDASESALRLVPYEEDLEYDQEAILFGQHTLSDFLPCYSRIIYGYDFGDNWQHDIRLVRILEDYDQESPYLLEASGQTPPEDVGATAGFLEFREIMLNPDHPKHGDMKQWAGYWEPELSDWRKKPRPIHI